MFNVLKVHLLTFVTFAKISLLRFLHFENPIKARISLSNVHLHTTILDALKSPKKAFLQRPTPL